MDLNEVTKGLLASVPHSFMEAIKLEAAHGTPGFFLYQITMDGLELPKLFIRRHHEEAEFVLITPKSAGARWECVSLKVI